MEIGMKCLLRFAGPAAAAIFFVVLFCFGAALDGYLHSLFPVALLGARGFPNATIFNLLAFVLPGMLAGVVTLELRQRLPGHAGWASRIGAQLLFLSALGFVAMGLLPLDPQDLESQTSRLHGTAWMLWCLSFIAGCVLLGGGLLRLRAWMSFGWLTLGAMAGIVVTAFLLTGLLPAGIAQRLAFAVWFAWLILVGSGYGADGGSPRGRTTSIRGL